MLDLNISDIQHFSTGDGPGIRTTVFFKGCNLRCPWCHNPETISPAPVTLTYPRTNRTVTYGRHMTVEDVMADVMEDADFYRRSGGGVTLSGGEPLLQHKAVAELAKLLKEHGVSVILDTAGCVPRSNLEVVLPFINTVFFDWKTADPRFMKEHVGGDYERIKDNLSHLLKTDTKVHIRIPLIPGVNTEDTQVTAMIAELRRLGAETVALLPFHRLAVGKYEAMGIPYPYRDTPPLPAGEIKRISLLYQEYFQVYTEK